MEEKTINDVSVFVINEYGDYIYAEEYDKQEDGDCLFVCLTNDFLNSDFGDDNSIYIYYDWKDELTRTYNNLTPYLYQDNVCRYQQGIGSIWQRGHIQIMSYSLMFGYNKIEYGYQNCKEIRERVEKLLRKQLSDDGLLNYFTHQEIEYKVLRYIPAVMLPYYMVVKYNGQDIHGFLPSVVQLSFISNNMDKINRILYNESKPKRILEGRWWSSNENDERTVMILDDGCLGKSNKNNYYSKTHPLIFPIFKIN